LNIVTRPYCTDRFPGSPRSAWMCLNGVILGTGGQCQSVARTGSAPDTHAKEQSNELLRAMCLVWGACRQAVSFSRNPTFCLTNRCAGILLSRTIRPASSLRRSRRQTNSPAMQGCAPTPLCPSDTKWRAEPVQKPLTAQRDENGPSAAFDRQHMGSNPTPRRFRVRLVSAAQTWSAPDPGLY
jgi:hypothetical protein